MLKLLPNLPHSLLIWVQISVWGAVGQIWMHCTMLLTLMFQNLLMLFWKMQSLKVNIIKCNSHRCCILHTCQYHCTMKDCFQVDFLSLAYDGSWKIAEDVCLKAELDVMINTSCWRKWQPCIGLPPSCLNSVVKHVCVLIAFCCAFFSTPFLHNWLPLLSAASNTNKLDDIKTINMFYCMF